jgi:hypothetical protein
LNNKTNLLRTAIVVFAVGIGIVVASGLTPSAYAHYGGGKTKISQSITQVDSCSGSSSCSNSASNSVTTHGKSTKESSQQPSSGNGTGGGTGAGGGVGGR